jgi:NTP pyrophosphatase (non-canonical NTP hydrolase)
MSQPEDRGPVTLDEFQDLIEATFGTKDAARGTAGTFMWLMEEVGELSAALREGTHADREGEFADVLAWVASLASLSGVRLSEAVRKYRRGCPRCAGVPCGCVQEKP